MEFSVYDWGSLRDDVLGSIFENLIPREEQALLGEFYTPPRVADLIVAFTLRGDVKAVLDPGCGSGTFLMRSYEYLREVAGLDHVETLNRLWGFDISSFAAELAAINLFRQDLSSFFNFPRIVPGNFFDHRTGETILFPPAKVGGLTKVPVPLPLFDVIVGNPPYLRSQNQDDLDPQYKRRLFEVSGRNNVEAESKTDLFAFFIYKSLEMMKVGSRLGFVTSSSWLIAAFGTPIKRLLFDRLRLVAIVTSDAEPFFSQVAVNAAILDAQDSSPGWVCPTNAAGSLCRLPAGNILPGGSITRFFAVVLDNPLPAGVANVTNTGCARSGPSLVLGCASTSTPTSGQPLLKVAKTLVSGSGTPGATLVFNLDISNPGNQDLAGTSITETVPPNTSYSSSASSPGWSCSGTTPGSACTFSLSALPAGDVTDLRFALVVANPLPAGTSSVANTACATSGAVSSCDTLTVPTNGMPSLSLKKGISGSSVPGGTLLFQLTLQNPGNQGASAVSLSELVPAFTTFDASASTAGWSCAPDGNAGATCTLAVGTLPAGSTQIYTFALTVVDPLPADASMIANRACASAPGLTDSCDSVSTPTEGTPNVTLHKTYSGPPLLPGAVLPFTLALSNAGDQDVGAVQITETVPDHSTFAPGASSPGWSCTAATPGSICTLAVSALPAGASQTYIFAVKADASLPADAVVENAACAATVLGPPPILESGSSAKAAATGSLQACSNTTTPPLRTVDTTLTVELLTDADGSHSATAGDTLRYVLTIPNATSGSLDGITTTLSLDPNTALVSGSVLASQGMVTTGNSPGDSTVVVAIGSLTAGQSATVRFDVLIRSPLPPGIRAVAAQASTSGTNFPTDPSDDPTTPLPDDPTSIAVDGGPAGPPSPVNVPTLSALGLVALAGLLSFCGSRALRRNRATPTSEPNR